jgi:excisionase family DNA binding protein
MNDLEQTIEIPKNWVPISEAAAYLRISKDTLRRWEKQSLLKAYRSPTNHRYYNKQELDYVFSKKPDIKKEESQKAESSKSSKPESNKVLFITACLLGIYIVLMVFLAFLLLNR